MRTGSTTKTRWTFEWEHFRYNFKCVPYVFKMNAIMQSKSIYSLELQNRRNRSAVSFVDLVIHLGKGNWISLSLKNTTRQKIKLYFNNLWSFWFKWKLAKLACVFFNSCCRSLLRFLLFPDIELVIIKHLSSKSIKSKLSFRPSIFCLLQWT